MKKKTAMRLDKTSTRNPSVNKAYSLCGMEYPSERTMRADHRPLNLSTFFQPLSKWSWKKTETTRSSANQPQRTNSGKKEVTQKTKGGTDTKTTNGVRIVSDKPNKEYFWSLRYTQSNKPHTQKTVQPRNVGPQNDRKTIPKRTHFVLISESTNKYNGFSLVTKDSNTKMLTNTWGMTNQVDLNPKIPQILASKIPKNTPGPTTRASNAKCKPREGDHEYNQSETYSFVLGKLSSKTSKMQ